MERRAEVKGRDTRRENDTEKKGEPVYWSLASTMHLFQLMARTCTLTGFFQNHREFTHLQQQATNRNDAAVAAASAVLSWTVRRRGYMWE